MATTTHSSNPGFLLTWAQRYKIGTRLLVGFSIPLLLFMAFGSWVWTSLSSVQNRIEVDMTEQVYLALHAKDLERDVIQVQQWLSDISATRGLDGLDDGFAEAAQSRDSFFKVLGEIEALFTKQHNQTELQTVKRLRVSFDNYYAAGTAMAKAYVSGGPSAGNPLMGQFDEASEALQVDLQKLVTDSVKNMKSGEQAVANETHQLRMVGLALCAGVALVSVAISLSTTKSIVNPIRYTAGVLQRVAKGDLAFSMSVHGNDEVAEMTESLSHMRERLAHVIGKMQRNADVVSSASLQIAQGNLDLSRRTEEQSSALHETSSSAAELGVNVTQSADQANEANRLARQATDVASKAGEVVKAMVTTMEDIQTSSKKISDIIGLIDSIAFQTNILALNAAVEAARAGDHGRGFAVVASEVRNLAGRSAEAAKEIRLLIGDSVTRVKTGTELATAAGATLDTAVDSIQKVSRMMTEMATATREENLGIQQIETAIHQLDSATQENASLVEEMARASESLRDEASALNDLAATFKVEHVSFTSHNRLALAS